MEKALGFFGVWVFGLVIDLLATLRNKWCLCLGSANEIAACISPVPHPSSLSCKMTKTYLRVFLPKYVKTRLEGNYSLKHI